MVVYVEGPTFIDFCITKEIWKYLALPKIEA